MLPPHPTPQEEHDVTSNNNAELCTNSIVAETIPHKRPTALELTAIEPLKTSKSIVKVTGQLFFDASHRSCKGTTPGSGDPARVTVYEIHPVYNIEVCSDSDISKCTGSSNNWKSVLKK